MAAIGDFSRLQGHELLCAGVETQLAAAAFCVRPGAQRPQGDSHPDLAAPVHPAVESDAALPHDQVSSMSTPISLDLPICAVPQGYACVMELKLVAVTINLRAKAYTATCPPLSAPELCSQGVALAAACSNSGTVTSPPMMSTGIARGNWCLPRVDRWRFWAE